MIDPVERVSELGLGESFTDVVAGEIVPWAQRRYHAAADPRAVVVGGLSLGGLEATWAAFRHPEVFGNVLSQSGSYWWFQSGDDEYEWLTRQIAAAPHKPIRFYLEVGLLEGARPGAPSMMIANRHLRDVLVARGYNVTFKTFAGGHHATSWRGTLGDALAGLLAGVHPRRATPAAAGDDLQVEDLGPSSFVTVLRAAALGGVEEAVRVFNGADKSGDLDEPALNLLGYELLYDVGEPRAAIAVFEAVVKRFPQSGNAYDSLAEAQFVAGDRASAAASYKKSLEVDPKNGNAAAFLKLVGPR
jgi:tetratricopeptide (TPR) repeat protein